MKISTIDLVIVIVYIVVVILFGILKSRNIKTTSDFLVAGRNMSLFMLIATIVMTEFNTATMIGYSSYGYQGGFYAELMLVATFVGFMCYTFIVSKRWKRINATSLIEFFQLRYGKKFRILTTFMMFALLLFFSPAYLRGIGLVFSNCLGISLEATVVIVSVGVLLFSVVGGLIAISNTNKLSFIITIIVLPLVVIVVRSHSIGLGGPSMVYPERYLHFNPIGMWNDPALPFSLILGTWFIKFFVYMQSPWYAQLMTSGKNEKTSFLGIGISTIIIVILYACAFQIGTYSRVGFPDLEDPQLTFPMVTNNWLPIGLSGLFLASIFAIGQTTIATIWNNIVSIFTNDIYKRIFNPEALDKKLLNLSRFITIAIAIFTIIVSVTIIDQVIHVLFIGNVLMASLFFPTLGGFLWWKTGEKAVWITTITSLVTGFGSALAMSQSKIYDVNDWTFFYYVIICPIIILLGIVISHFEKTSEELTAKKIKFFDIVGAPWFGKKIYLECKNKAAKK